MYVKVFKAKTKDDQIDGFDTDLPISRGDIIHHPGGTWIVRSVAYEVGGGWEDPDDGTTGKDLSLRVHVEDRQDTFKL
jgi:hypothetical protein